MKKSAQIRLGLLASLAVSLSSCRSNSREMQRCIDESETVVDDHNCRDANQITPTHYHWYYGGGGAYSLGTRVSGGSYSPHEGIDSVTWNGTVSHSSSVTRGGFGETGASHSTGAGGHSE